MCQRFYIFTVRWFCGYGMRARPLAHTTRPHNIWSGADREASSMFVCVNGVDVMIGCGSRRWLSLTLSANYVAKNAKDRINFETPIMIIIVLTFSTDPHNILFMRRRCVPHENKREVEETTMVNENNNNHALMMLIADCRRQYKNKNANSILVYFFYSSSMHSLIQFDDAHSGLTYKNDNKMVHDDALIGNLIMGT